MQRHVAVTAVEVNLKNNSATVTTTKEISIDDFAKVIDDALSLIHI